ncbi:MAG: DUF4129 domain-containing protein [Pseudomonadota bacterium]|nr:DUF4129 domain-containing protein [Pseudomonadota bacterium]
MRLEGITIALRPRSPWEAADLGVALVRQHAARIYSAWVLVTLPACVLLSLLGALIDQVWLGGLLLWWLKPVFDRIPLFVLSRAVFGATPTLRETLRAQGNWGWRAWRWLHWRRLHPGRALLLPVDLLEGLSGSVRRERCRVLARATGSPSLLIWVIGWHVDMMLYFSLILLGLMFVPIEFLPDSAKAVWETMFQSPPLWVQGLNNLLYWLAMSIMEPFYVGAGFGLYLNRRTLLEAWDIELAFRRLATRLRQVSVLLLVCAGLLITVTPALRAQTIVAVAVSSADNAQRSMAVANVRAAEQEKAESSPRQELIESAEGMETESDLDEKGNAPISALPEVFSKQYRDDGAAFEKSVGTAYQDKDLNPKATVQTWERRVPEVPGKPSSTPEWLQGLARIIAFLGENGLWILVGLLLVVLIRNANRWLPWFSDRFVRGRALDPIEVHDIAVAEPLPDDLPAAVQALWRSGQQRAALALFYRAAVQRLIDALGTPLPPGATESECMRQAHRLRDREGNREKEFAGLFARIVRSWQGIAYAQRTPSTEDINGLLSEWQRLPEAAP